MTRISFVLLLVATLVGARSAPQAQGSGPSIAAQEINLPRYSDDIEGIPLQAGMGGNEIVQGLDNGTVGRAQLVYIVVIDGEVHTITVNVVINKGPAHVTLAAGLDNGTVG